MNCPKCGNELKPNMKFCAKCGTAVSQSAQPTLTAPQQPAVPQPQKPAEPKKEFAQPTPSAPAQNPADAKPAKQKKAKKNGKKNLPLKIIAIILVIAVLLTGGLFITDSILFKTESDKGDYITDFPVLKQNTELLVYDAEKFPYEDYNIKVDRFKTGKVFKSSTFSGFENVINEKSNSKIFNIDFEEDGKYQITLEGIVTERTQAVPTAPSSETTTTTTTAKAEEQTTITIIVVVDNDDKDAVDKVTINSKKDDEPIKEFDGVASSQTPSNFIEATDADIEEFEKMLSAFMELEIDTFDYKTATTKDIIDFLVAQTGLSGYSYFFKYDTFMESVALNGFEMNSFVMYETDIQWICENVFNIKYTQDFIDNQVYISRDGKVYRPVGNFGTVLSYSAVVSEQNIVGNKYELIADMKGNGWNGREYRDEYIKSLKITAEIKIIDGKRYWSIYKIEDYDPNADSTPSTPKDMYDENAKLYNESLKDESWGKYMPDWYGMDSYDIQTCMFDMNDDGVYELLVKFVPNSSDCYATESLLFTIKNDGVVFLHKEHDEGYRLGGTQLSIFYDNVQKKNVLVAYTAEGDGGNAGHTAYKTFDYDGTNLKEKDNYEVSSYRTDERGYNLFKDQIDKIKSESNLYVMDGDIIRSYTLNGNYISEAEYEKNTENRFEDPTDSKYQMKQGTYENPLGL